MIKYEHQYRQHTITFFYPDLHRHWLPVVLRPTLGGKQEIPRDMLTWLQENITGAWLPVYQSEYLIEPDPDGSQFGGTASNADFTMILFRSKADAALFKMFHSD